MNTQSERLVSDVKVLVKDTEDLVMATASQAGDKIIDIRNRAQQAVANLKPQLAKLESAVVERAKTTAAATDTYIHENPWTAIGVPEGMCAVELVVEKRSAVEGLEPDWQLHRFGGVLAHGCKHSGFGP